MRSPCRAPPEVSRRAAADSRTKLRREGRPGVRRPWPRRARDDNSVEDEHIRVREASQGEDFGQVHRVDGLERDGPGWPLRGRQVAAKTPPRASSASARSISSFEMRGTCGGISSPSGVVLTVGRHEVRCRRRRWRHLCRTVAAGRGSRRCARSCSRPLAAF